MFKFLQKAHKIISMKNNSFKINKTEFVSKTFRLPVELIKELQTIAQNQGISLNKLVQKCCEYAIKNMD